MVLVGWQRAAQWSKEYRAADAECCGAGRKREAERAQSRRQGCGTKKGRRKDLQHRKVHRPCYYSVTIADKKKEKGDKKDSKVLLSPV